VVGDKKKKKKKKKKTPAGKSGWAIVRDEMAAPQTFFDRARAAPPDKGPGAAIMQDCSARPLCCRDHRNRTDSLVAINKREQSEVE
jgi:hypothetical protein